MPSKYAKIQKHVTKKKGAAKLTALHEESRDARRLRKAVVRDDRVARMSAVREKANENYLLRITSFQDYISSRPPSNPDTDTEPDTNTTDTSSSTTIQPLTEPEIHDLITTYLSRECETLDLLISERRAGRPKSNRHTLLEQAMELERKEYDAGFWMPDLRDRENLKALARWEGSWSSLAVMRFVRVVRGGGVRESGFPPTGAV